MVEARLTIGGELVAGDYRSGVVNPATGRAFAECPRASPALLDSAVAAAQKAFVLWRKTEIAERAHILLQIAERLEANVDLLAPILTQEVGKPLAEARAEIAAAAAFFRRFAAFKLPTSLLEDSARRRVERCHVALGVVGAIVPWNFPIQLMAFKLPPALLAGNTVILKPAGTTPLTTLKFGELINGLLPPGVLNVIADENELGAAMVAHPGIRKISFTGSNATGAKVMASAAETFKRVTLELGGNDAAIVLDDADPAKVAPAIFRSAFRNNGQICIAIKRVYAPASLYDELCDRLLASAASMVVGNGMDENVQLGPLQNHAQFERVRGLVEGARHHATVLDGGNPIPDEGYFLRPTVVRDIEDGVALVDEEQFGPVLPIIRCTDQEDAVRRANASNFGLGASVWGRDIERAEKVASEMEAGTVWINIHADLDPAIPFCAAKHSGIGTELGEAGLLEFAQSKVINLAH